MPIPLKVLTVEDSEDDARLLAIEFRKGGLNGEFTRVESQEELRQALQQNTWDVILCDYSMPHFSGMAALKIIREVAFDVPVIFVSGAMGEDRAVEAMRAGANDYMMKDKLKRLAPAVERELRDAAVRAERRKVEESLRKLSRAVEQSPVAIVITDTKGGIEYVNPKFTQMTGYTPAEAIGQNPGLYKSGEIPASQFAQLWEHIGTGKEWHGEFQNLRKTGELYWEKTLISPIRDQNGATTHFLAVKEDITQHKQAQEQIREQAALLDQTQDVVLVMGVDMRLRYCNRAAMRIYGMSAEQLLNQDPTLILFTERPTRCSDVCQSTLDRGTWTGETQFTTALGLRRIALSRWTLICDAEGKPSAYLIVNTDITEQKRLEEQFLRAQRMESIGILASGVAHDLNNILAPILMATGLLRSLATSDEDKETVDVLEQSAHRGADIVSQLLTLGRGGDGGKSTLDLRILLREIGKIVQETFPKDLTFKQYIPENLWKANANPTQIHQVLLNLCVNARDAMPQGGRLTISAENVVLDATAAAMIPEARPGPYAVLQISDTGTGIPPEIIHKIFDPFFTTKEFGKGSGLGLSTVQGIVKNHGGFVQVNSRLGEGTQFKVYLPSIDVGEDQKPETPAEPLPRGEGKLILMVDDEESVRIITKRILEANGYRVLTASDGAEALVTYSRSSEPPAAVITDMLMPVMDGPALIRALRRLSTKLSIIAVSGLPEQEDVAAHAGLGAGAFLIKPYSSEVLLRTLHSVLTRAANA